MVTTLDCRRDETYTVIFTGDFTFVLARAVCSDLVEEADETVVLHTEGRNGHRSSQLILVPVPSPLVPDNLCCCHHHLPGVCQQQHAMYTQAKTHM